MTPRLVLLTGPAAGEVAAVLREMTLGTCCANRDGECFQPGCPQLRDGEPKRSGRSCPVPWPHHFEEGEELGPTWDEVRDYWEASRQICCCQDAEAEHGMDWTCRPVDAAIRSLPGGEEWLVGLVLPDNEGSCRLQTHSRREWGCRECRDLSFPGWETLNRLAILAPHLHDDYEDYTDENGRARIRKVPLLMERVRAWGGQAWFCASDVGEQACSIALGANEEEACESARAHGQTLPCEWEADTWPEAVRAALGEGL